MPHNPGRVVASKSGTEQNGVPKPVSGRGGAVRRTSAGGWRGGGWEGKRRRKSANSHGQS